MKAKPKILIDTLLFTISIAKTNRGKRLKISTYLNPTDCSDFYFDIKTGKIISKKCTIKVKDKELSKLYGGLLNDPKMNVAEFIKNALPYVKYDEIEEHYKRQLASIINGNTSNK